MALSVIFVLLQCAAAVTCPLGDGACLSSAGQGLLQVSQNSGHDELGGQLSGTPAKTKQLKIVLESAADVAKMSRKIMKAMRKANTTLSEWVPVSSDSMNLTDNLSFPVTYTITLSRSSKWKQFQEPIESQEEEDAYEKSKAAEEQKAKEAEKLDPAAHEGSSDIKTSLLALSVEEGRERLRQIHIERFGMLSPEARSAASINEVQVDANSSDLSHAAVLLSLQAIKKKKNSKQIKWASKAASKLEAEVCTRAIKGKPVARTRSSRALSCTFDWFETRCSCSGGWEDIWGVCYEPCKSNEVGIWFACHATCNGWEDTGSTCNERCNLPSLTHVGTTCGLGYCSKDTGACVEKIVKLAVAFLEAMSNFIPGATAMSTVRGAAVAGTKAAIKTALKKAVKDVAKNLVKDAKKNLRKYMKKEGKELRDELLDAVIEDGCETAAESTVAKDEADFDVRQAAEELIMAVDPTGVSGIINEFEADSCESKKIEDMPMEGFIESICPDSITLSGGENAQSTRMGLFEYTGEDNYERPIYMNSHNQFLYYLTGKWLVGSDTTSSSAGVVHYTYAHCPPLGTYGWKHWNWKISPAVWTSSPAVTAK